MKVEHPDQRPFQCQVCEATFHVKYDLRIHETSKCTSHPDYGTKSYCFAPRVCEVCGKTLASEFSYNQHKKHLHNGQEQSLVCDICGRSFQKASVLNDHKAVAHGEQEVTKDFVCDKCGKGFARPDLLRLHIDNTHLRKSVVCTLCEKFITSAKSLKTHMRSQHGIELIARNNKLKDYMVCDQCHSIFEKSTDLNIHMESEHNLKAEHPCTKCDHIFVTNVLLTAHIMESHDYDPLKENSLQVDDIKKFRCDICGAHLKSKETLFLHVKQNHEKESHKHKCDLCAYTAYRGADLTQHILRTHSNVKPYKCTECDFAASLPKFLKVHMQNYH